MNFFRYFYDLSAYRSIINQSLKKTFGHLLFFYLILSIIIGIYIHIVISPQIITHFQNFSSSLTSQLDPSYTLTISPDGTLSTQNISTPLFISLPDSFNVYIDSQQDLVALASVSANLALGQNGIRITPPQTQESYVEKYPTVNSSVSVSGQEIISAFSQLTSFISERRITLVAIFILLITLILFINRLFYTGFYAILFLMGSQLFSRTYSYKSFLNLLFYTGFIADVINLVIFGIYREPHIYIGQLAFILISILVYFSLPAYKIDHKS